MSTPILLDCRKRLKHPNGEDLHRRTATGVPLDVSRMTVASTERRALNVTVCTPFSWSPQVLQHVGLSSVTLPESAKVHPRLLRTFIQARLKVSPGTDCPLRNPQPLGKGTGTCL